MPRKHVFVAEPISPPEQMIQICFSDKSLLELTFNEAGVVYDELKEVLGK